MDSVVVTVCDDHRAGEIDKNIEEECLNRTESASVAEKPIDPDDDRAGCYNESFSKSESAVSVEIDPESADGTAKQDAEPAEQSDAGERAGSVDGRDVHRTRL